MTTEEAEDLRRVEALAEKWLSALVGVPVRIVMSVAATALTRAYLYEREQVDDTEINDWVTTLADNLRTLATRPVHEYRAIVESMSAHVVKHWARRLQKSNARHELCLACSTLNRMGAQATIASRASMDLTRPDVRTDSSHDEGDMALNDLRVLLGNDALPADVAETMADTLPESQLEARRLRVLQLRLRRFSEAAIGAAVGCSEATASRDLKWWRALWAKKYAVQSPIFRAEEAIGEAVSLYEDAESLALLEFARLNEINPSRRISPMFAARQRMACLRSAVSFRQATVGLLQDVGLLDRQLGTVGLVSSNDMAAAVRERLKKAGVIRDEVLVSDGERLWTETGNAGNGNGNGNGNGGGHLFDDLTT